MRGIFQAAGCTGVMDVVPAVVLQSGFEFDLESVDLGLSVAGGAVGSFLTTLLVGGILVALAPDYTRRMMDAVREDLVGSFVYGILCLVGLVLFIVVLVLSVLGILVVVPLVVLATLVWAAGASVAFLAVAERLVDTEEGWLKPLALAAAFNGGLALTGVGSLVSFAVGATGFGAILRDRFG